MSQPIQIIRTAPKASNIGNADVSDENSQFVLEKEALAAILSKVPEGMHVSVVSVVGAFRTGKSFLLTLFLRYLRCSNKDDKSLSWLFQEGEVTEGNNNNSNDNANASFAWRGGSDRMTTGIWMWSEPFIRYSQSEGKDVAILLMDTQGMFDNESTMQLTAQIFGISTLVSSYQIYNVQNTLGEDKLQHLALFSEYGRLALEPASEDQDQEESESEKKKTISTEKLEEDSKSENENETENDRRRLPEAMLAIREEMQKKTKSGQKPFQHLQFVVRDWASFTPEWPSTSNDNTSTEIRHKNDITYTYNKEENQCLSELHNEMKDYFHKVISQRAASDLQSTRNQISRCFETVEAYLLPHPGTIITKKSFNGNLVALDEMFLHLVNDLTRNIFDIDSPSSHGQGKLEPKRINGRHVTANELLNFFDVYCKVFREGGSKFPKAMTILEATAEANNRNAYDLAIGKYKARMTTVLDTNGYVPIPEFHAYHDAACVQAWEVFKEVANMGSITAIEDTSVKLNNDIATECARYTEMNHLRNPYKDFEKYFLPIMIAIVSWITSVLVHATCDAPICHSAKAALGRIYMSVFCILVVIFWAHIRAAIGNIKKFFELMNAGNAGNAGAGIKRD
jgi:atlastin